MLISYRVLKQFHQDEPSSAMEYIKHFCAISTGFQFGIFVLFAQLHRVANDCCTGAASWHPGAFKVTGPLVSAYSAQVKPIVEEGREELQNFHGPVVKAVNLF